MQNFTKTLSILNSMIQKLEANVGGAKEGAQAAKKEQTKPNLQAEEQKTEKPSTQQAKGKDQAPEDNSKKEKKKQEKSKVEGQKGQKPAKKQGGKQPPKPTEVDPKFFAQIDMRIGSIVECWKHPESENLYCEKINIGEQGPRQIASGLQKYVPHEKMTGNVIVMANLKPRPLAGFASNGMVVCASSVDHTSVQLLIPEGEIGERVYLEGHEELFTKGDILPVVNPKRKVVEKCLEHFKTDEEGFVVWQGIRLRTIAGQIKAATIKNGNVG